MQAYVHKGISKIADDIEKQKSSSTFLLEKIEYLHKSIFLGIFML